MDVQLRQQRFHAGARAALERRGEWAQLSRSGGPAVGEDPPVGQDQVRMVPSLLDICALAGGRDATAEPEDEDVLFGRDGAEPDLEADDNDDDDDNLAESWNVGLFRSSLFETKEANLHARKLKDVPGTAAHFVVC